jgi:hypothetical protein
MNQTFANVIVGASKALFAAGYNTAPKIAALLNSPSEPESDTRLALKALFAENAYSHPAQANEASVDAKLRSYVGLANSSGETIQRAAPHNVFSVS